MRFRRPFRGQDAELSRATRGARPDQGPDPRIGHLRLERLYHAGQRNAPMEDQHILVLGADYAFVCDEAVRQKAASVVLLTQEIASSPDDGIERLSGDLTVLADRRFDAIFLPQAHSCPDLRALLDQLKTFLRPKGVVILEIACAKSGTGLQWTVIEDETSQRRYPTAQLLDKLLLQDFAIRKVGKGVLRNDDKIGQTIYHCTPMQSTAVIITGKSGHGKSNLLRFFNAEGFPSVSTDTFLSRLNKSNTGSENSLAARIRAEIGDASPDWGQVGRMIAATPDLTEVFCEALVATCPLEARIFLLEGEILRHEAVAECLTRRLNRHDVRVWAMTPRAL